MIDIGGVVSVEVFLIFPHVLHTYQRDLTRSQKQLRLV